MAHGVSHADYSHPYDEFDVMNVPQPLRKYDTFKREGKEKYIKITKEVSAICMIFLRKVPTKSCKHDPIILRHQNILRDLHMIS